MDKIGIFDEIAVVFPEQLASFVPECVVAPHRCYRLTRSWQQITQDPDWQFQLAIR
jgi:hypothetical protein